MILGCKAMREKLSRQRLGSTEAAVQTGENNCVIYWHKSERYTGFPGKLNKVRHCILSDNKVLLNREQGDGIYYRDLRYECTS
jgi:hypothetical protein